MGDRMTSFAFLGFSARIIFGENTVPHSSTVPARQNDSRVKAARRIAAGARISGRVMSGRRFVNSPKRQL